MIICFHIIKMKKKKNSKKKMTKHNKTSSSYNDNFNHIFQELDGSYETYDIFMDDNNLMCNNIIEMNINKKIVKVKNEMKKKKKKCSFEKLYNETKRWYINKEKELVEQKRSNILCKQELKHMGWSGDFIIKKNVKKMDFFVDIFFNIPSNIYKDNFICSQYFPYTNKPLNNFLNIFEKIFII